MVIDYPKSYKPELNRNPGCAVSLTYIHNICKTKTVISSPCPNKRLEFPSKTMEKMENTSSVLIATSG